MSSKSKKRPSYPMTLTKAVSHALVIFLWAFCTAFSPSPEAFDRLKAEVESVRDSVLCGALTIPQIRKAIRDEYGWEVGA